ncbi:MAG: cation/H(+) antiporter [Lysobacterales bacterium CG17_big_fil_post_rev_8_21_14_2_50_64_11]|nr:MAG: cation/H(+) antiporter [Xanthomonadales bacterium CG17_big_fil_post_rev_8_21_14_2_50_64_11]PIX59236.1 MAG: cation/H(+) antiporter [Xanthomonadales bacterium CG_4_10_14_3_um_filter_64_11]
MIETLLIAMIVILGAPYAIWRLGRTDYYAPLVVVQIITGIVLGPGILGTAYPELYRQVLNPQVSLALAGIAAWAVMVFVWIAGIELDLHEAWAKRRDSATTASLAMGTPLLFGALAASLMLLHDRSWMGGSTSAWQFIAGVGMACAVTALPILILFMEKLDILRQPLGQRVLRYASLDDIAIWAVMALVLLDFDRLGRQVEFLLGFAAATLLMRRAFVRLPESDRWYLALIWLAACGLAADWAGLHYMVGAFLAGVVMDGRWFNRERMDLLRHHLLLVAMPVFFLSTGLRTQWAMGGWMVFAAAALLLLASVGGKLLGTHLAGRVLGWGKGEATIIGWLLQTKALIMIIFANILLDRAVISSTTFTALLLMAVASTMLSVPMVAPRLRALR